MSPIRKRYRQSSFVVTMAEWQIAPQSFHGPLDLDITFHPPDNRRRDLDNMLASIKSGLDGISDALGVDDSTWTLTIRRGETCKPEGYISVYIKERETT